MLHTWDYLGKIYKTRTSVEISESSKVFYIYYCCLNDISNLHYNSFYSINIM